MKRRPWTNKDDEMLREAFSKKIPARELAPLLNRSINAIYVRAHTLGVYVYRFNREEFEKLYQQIKKSIQNGYTAKQTAENLGIPIKKLYDILKWKGTTSIKLRYQFKRKEEPPKREIMLPCMIPARKLQICREHRCYNRHKCEAFQKALLEGKTRLTNPPDWHASGNKKNKIGELYYG